SAGPPCPISWFPGRTSKTGGKYAVAPAACQISLAKYPVPGPRLKIRRKIYRRPGRLSNFTREVPGARAAPQNSAENMLPPRPPGWFKVRHFSLILPELIEELQNILLKRVFMHLIVSFNCFMHRLIGFDLPEVTQVFRCNFCQLPKKSFTVFMNEPFFSTNTENR
nr:hypothetical protein [Acidobacteriota bacterium]